MAIIICTENLDNEGRCFTKGKEYETDKLLHNKASLMEAQVVNDLGEKHIIGMWWRKFNILTQQ